MKTIIKSKQLIFDPEKPPISTGVVIIQDDRIVDVGTLQSIEVPQESIVGCKLCNRCSYTTSKCKEPQELREVEENHWVRCWQAEKLKLKTRIFGMTL